MNKSKLHELLWNCVAYTESGPGIVPVKMHNLTVAVNEAAVLAAKDELKQLLATYDGPHTLAEGPSYIEVGAVVGDQRDAFILFAVGQVLGFWKVITPESLGIEGPQADELAGSGMIMLEGYNPEA